MGVLSEKKTSQRTKDIWSPVRPGSRAVVVEGKTFEAFKSGDEGAVLSVDKEAGTCEIRFDGFAFPTKVAIRHLRGVASGDKKLTSSSSDSCLITSSRNDTSTSTQLFTSEAKTNKPLFKSIAKSSSKRENDDSPLASPKNQARESPVKNEGPSWGEKFSRSSEGNQTTEKNKSVLRPRFNIVPKESWKEDGPPTPLARPVPHAADECQSLGTNSDCVTELLDSSGVEASLWYVLQECMLAMSGCLCASAGLASGSADMFGAQRQVKMADDGSYQQWQQSLVVLQSALESCHKELRRVSTAKRLPKAPIEVPIERLHPKISAGVTRSWSSPLLNSVPSTSSPLVGPAHSKSPCTSVRGASSPLKEPVMKRSCPNPLVNSVSPTSPPSVAPWMNRSCSGSLLNYVPSTSPPLAASGMNRSCSNPSHNSVRATSSPSVASGMNRSCSNPLFNSAPRFPPSPDSLAPGTGVRNPMSMSTDTARRPNSAMNGRNTPLPSATASSSASPGFASFTWADPVALLNGHMWPPDSGPPFPF